MSRTLEQLTELAKQVKAQDGLILQRSELASVISKLDSFDELRDLTRALCKEFPIGSGVTFWGSAGYPTYTFPGAFNDTKSLLRNTPDGRDLALTDIGRLFSEDDVGTALNDACRRFGIDARVALGEAGTFQLQGTASGSSIWGILSEEAARAASGDVYALTLHSPTNRIFGQNEFPILIKNGNVTNINGVPRAVLWQELDELTKLTGQRSKAYDLLISRVNRASEVLVKDNIFRVGDHYQLNPKAIGGADLIPPGGVAAPEAIAIDTARAPSSLTFPIPGVFLLRFSR